MTFVTLAGASVTKQLCCFYITVDIVCKHSTIYLCVDQELDMKAAAILSCLKIHGM